MGPLAPRELLVLPFAKQILTGGRAAPCHLLALERGSAVIAMVPRW